MEWTLTTAETAHQSLVIFRVFKVALEPAITPLRVRIRLGGEHEVVASGIATALQAALLSGGHGLDRHAGQVVAHKIGISHDRTAL